jgi:hypothetical protein
MADVISYPDTGYGIMPNNAFNKYMRFQNQRRASTGMGATPSDQQAFWEGTMDSVVKNASTRAAQNLEKKKLDATIDYQNRQLDNADKTRESNMIAGLATYPMTALMYDLLGVNRKEGTQSWTGKTVDSLFGLKKKAIPAPTDNTVNYPTRDDIYGSASSQAAMDYSSMLQDNPGVPYSGNNDYSFSMPIYNNTYSDTYSPSVPSYSGSDGANGFDFSSPDLSFFDWGN